MAAASQETHASAVRPRSYQDESYLHGFLGTVGDLQKDGVLQDVFLEVEGRRFPCHRLVLSAASPYFRAMFTSDMAESRQKTVVLQGLAEDMFGEILSYIYSGTLHVSMDTVQPLYQAADLLQLDYMRDTCSSYMAMNVERSTCVDLYKFADVFSVDIVMKSCLKWKARLFTEVASSEEFCSLGVNELTEIISHDELDVKEETTVWEAVVRWVQHSRKDRLRHLPSILPHIRFNLLTSDNMAAILGHPLVRENHGISEVIRHVVQKGKPNLKPRLGMTKEMVLLYHRNLTSNELLFMTPREGKYISCSYKAEVLPHITDVTVTSDNNIYILSRNRESNYSSQLSLLMYNHVGNVWEHAGMSSVSRWLRLDNDLEYDEHLVEVDGILYYLAAEVMEHSGSVWMRKYNRHTDQWQECSHLQVGASSYMDYSEALACSSHLYFLTCSEVHCYDPSNDHWCNRTPSPEPVLDIYTAVTMGTEIFCTDIHFTQTMVYDTDSDYWQKLSSWSNPGNRDICVPSLFVLENQLHIWLPCYSGGEHVNEEYLLYVYDRSADAWRDLKASLPDKEYYWYGCQCPVARIYEPYLKGAQKHITSYACQR
ncbi:kelch-like protein 12 [Branchiostoma floridae]|uniref:Kelch-like protein 12 n=1 Tax=Branchiostoma floridae TaxID=7739 RepID=A0A9J7HKV3_BRAFL|nr:kelch-like protein 12 [Branchiostoma floridae]